MATHGAARLGPVLFAGGLAAVAGSFLARAGTEAARESGAFRVDPARVEVLALPAWVPAGWIDDLARTLEALGSFSIFDPAAPSLLRETLAGLDWIEVAAEPEREFPRAMRVVLRPRLPVARVDLGGPGPLLVDEAGRLLPRLSEEEAAALDLPLLVPGETPFLAPPRIGRTWPDRRVAAGASAAADAKALEGWTRVRVAAIDVSNAGDLRDPTGSEVVFVTDLGARILWGRASAASPYGELDPGEKAGALAQVLAAYPRLAGVDEVDLRFDQAVATLSPAADARSANGEPTETP